MFMAAVGYDAAYPELDLEKYLNDNGRELLRKAEHLRLVSVDGIGTSPGRCSRRSATTPPATRWTRRSGSGG